jgi:hypothetical protein
MDDENKTKQAAFEKERKKERNKEKNKERKKARYKELQSQRKAEKEKEKEKEILAAKEKQKLGTECLTIGHTYTELQQLYKSNRPEYYRIQASEQRARQRIAIYDHKEEWDRELAEFDRQNKVPGYDQKEYKQKHKKLLRKFTYTHPPQQASDYPNPPSQPVSPQNSLSQPVSPQNSPSPVLTEDEQRLKQRLERLERIRIVNRETAANYERVLRYQAAKMEELEREQLVGAMRFIPTNDYKKNAEQVRQLQTDLERTKQLHIATEQARQLHIATEQTIATQTRQLEIVATRQQKEAEQKTEGLRKATQKIQARNNMRNN